MLISPRQIAGNEHAYYGSGETGLNNPIVVFIGIGRESHFPVLWFRRVPEKLGVALPVGSTAPKNRTSFSG